MRSWCICLFALGCQSKADPPAPPAPQVIEARDATGVIARLTPGHPCRGSIGQVELQVGGPPLVAQQGSARWTSEETSGGTVLIKDGQRQARVFPVGDANALAVFDGSGVALARIDVAKGHGSVHDAGGMLRRGADHKASAIAIDAPAATVTGTTDLPLALLLAAPEIPPEIRILAACARTSGST